ncbi:prepilin peptidase [Citreimonas salinaria]|uniref:Flp pilus assembly protein, protease CpaA n=1 Tax=Citreimonas salinaria TaxID=321339 RepID=A0A1H3LZR5_9RHOB|nr:prepilin peptidase [Citreimonas salinaria]SDY69504.1 Flp pilus assembly protein, protease CpaA [Citreimonas salinaria]
MLPTAIAMIAILLAIVAGKTVARTDLQRREIGTENVFALVLAGVMLAYAAPVSPDQVWVAPAFAAFLALVMGTVSFSFPNRLGMGDALLLPAGMLFAGQHGAVYLASVGIGALGLCLVSHRLQKRVAALGLEPVLSDDLEHNETMPADWRHNLGCPELPFGLVIAAAVIVTAFVKIFASDLGGQ